MFCGRFILVVVEPFLRTRLSDIGVRRFLSRSIVCGRISGTWVAIARCFGIFLSNRRRIGFSLSRWRLETNIAIGQLIETKRYGTYHFVNSGGCSRWEFANEILKLAGIEAENAPILSSEFKRASTPPPYGILHNINGKQAGIELRPWQEALVEFIQEM